MVVFSQASHYPMVSFRLHRLFLTRVYLRGGLPVARERIHEQGLRCVAADGVG